MNLPRTIELTLTLGILFATGSCVRADDGEPISISGRYPHLAMFNHGQECGIGAVVPWAGKLWAVTYSPHMPRGSDDKLYAVDRSLGIEVFPGSVGGTPANRLIHRESNQLIIGPYFIDAQRNVRVLPYSKAPGRPTATTRHLNQPADKVYLFTMEEGLYEIDVHSLDVKTIHPDGHAQGFVDYLPGYHGKGAYVGQGRLVVANNGAKRSRYAFPYNDKTGCLAEWDGSRWGVLEEKPFCEVTGPGGIEGNAREDDPIWATGWDRRSVILKLLDGGRWYTFRLPIGDYSYTAAHGWFTEWPRIREVVPARNDQPEKLLMNMHGLWFDFPKTFSAKQTAGIRPLAGYLKITADFCHFDGRIVFACDDTAITGGNRFVNQSQSNLWFTSFEALGDCGRPAGWGGVWVRDDVEANRPSDPYLLAGFQHRVLHLTHESDHAVRFTIEVDRQGDGQWTVASHVTVPGNGYRYVVLDRSIQGQWIRLRSDKDAKGATAYFHYGPGGGAVSDPAIAANLADVRDPAPCSVGIVRPRGGDLGTLQFLAHREDEHGRKQGKSVYYEMGPDMKLRTGTETADAEDYLRKTAGLEGADFQVDAASVVVTEGERRYRLPKSHPGYDAAWSVGWPRGIREVVTERRLLNCHGTIYVLPHKAAGSIATIKPVCTHDKRITDFCSWRGLLVLAGVRTTTTPDMHTIVSEDGQAALWCGDVDDLWKLGKPRGVGGPLRDTPVRPGEPSDPYLMTGYDHKHVLLSHDSQQDVTFSIQVDFLCDDTWKIYRRLSVPAGKTVQHTFPEGFSAHWVRLQVDRPCRATARFRYE